MVHKLLSGCVTMTYSWTPVCALCFCRCMFSMWIFVTRQCQNHLCGLFHHIDSQNNFATPALFLKRSGRIIIQVFPLTIQRLAVKMRTETKLSSLFFHHTHRPVAHPAEGGIWWIVCISLFIQSAFRRVVSYQSDVAESNGEKSLYDMISTQHVCIMTTIRYKRSLFLLRCLSP